MMIRLSGFASSIVLLITVILSAPAGAQDDSGVAGVDPNLSSYSSGGADPNVVRATAPSEPATAASDESQATSRVASFTATRLKDSPAVVTVISGDDIRASGVRDLIDILYLVPGFFVGVDTEGVVGPGIRGLWGYEGKILLIIDGKEMNELLFSTTQLGNEFPVELIERVEVVRGPGSVIYGGSAELAVINVVTRSLQGATDTLFSATYGQMTGANSFGNGFARRRITASGRYVVDAVPGLSTFASVSLGEGQRSVGDYVDNNQTSSPMEGQSALNPTVVQAGVGYRDLQATFLYHRLAMTSVDGLGAALSTPFGMSFDSYHAALVGGFRPTNRVELVPRFDFTYQTPWRLTDNADFLYDKSARRLRPRMLARWAALDQLQITVGGDAMFDHAELLAPSSVVNTPFGSSNEVSHETYAAFAELFSENPIVNIAAGARYDHLSSVGGALVPRLALQRTFGGLSLKGIYSQSFRAPAIENLNGGANIRPERTRIFEFEGSYDMTTSQRLSANVFDISIDAPIAFFTDPATMADKYINLGRQGSRGVEVTYRMRDRMLSIDANYSFYAVSHADNTPTYSVPGHSSVFLAAPAHRASLRATLRPVAWLKISPSATLLGTRYMRGPDDPTGAETAISVDPTLLANLFVYSDHLSVPGLSVGVGVYNIFASKYQFLHVAASPGTYPEDHAPMPGLDREVMVQVSYSFDGTADSSIAKAPRSIASSR